MGGHVRPLGHTEARAERHARLPPDDESLQEAWEAFLVNVSSVDDNIDGDALMATTRDLLRPLTFSMASLEHLVLRTEMPAKSSIGTYLGVFLSAGFSVLPDEEIIYRLRTPQIRYLGWGLEKDLTIIGHVGDETGFCMTGTCIVTGTVGDYAGHGMVGMFANHGVVGDAAGLDMIGSFYTTGATGHFPGGRVPEMGMVGGWVFEEPSDGMLGRYTDGRRADGGEEWWNFTGDRGTFLLDIKNPKKYDGITLRKTLRKTYGAKR
jgi:hypothetical protein